MADFFGYGSLVNLLTHTYVNPRPTKIKGWKRIWVSSNIHDIAFLSVETCNSTQLQGMRASTENIGWDALDLRETGYNRQQVDNHDMQIYVGETKYINTSIKNPILLSYLDCVIQGYYKHFGEDGVIDFFSSTKGWDHPIFNDRSSPKYPRATKLSKYEFELVDAHIQKL